MRNTRWALYRFSALTIGSASLNGAVVGLSASAIADGHHIAWVFGGLAAIALGYMTFGLWRLLVEANGLIADLMEAPTDDRA